jgi:hypothetical protein
VSEIDRVHETRLEVESIDLTPPHPPRHETEAYHKSHHFLIYEKDSPCVVCGVRHSTLADPVRNPLKARYLETHHSPIEWSLASACDIRKVHAKFPQVIDEETFQAFIDSPVNLVVLCDKCHVSREYGVHHLSVPDWMIRPFLLDSYIVASDPAHAAQDEAHDAEIIREATQQPED